jgi:hypothetical protein
MPISLISSVMNMRADVYVQQNIQSPTSGVIVREWVYDKSVQCKVEPIKTSGSSNRADNKSFVIGKTDEYSEKLQLKMKVLIPMSKRWRISAIRSSDNMPVYTELDKYDNPDTIFDITASHVVLDPFGKISYYEVTLQRVHVQNDNTSSE